MSFRELPPMVDDDMADRALVALYSTVLKSGLPRRGTKKREAMRREVRFLLLEAALEMERRALARAGARIAPTINGEQQS